MSSFVASFVFKGLLRGKGEELPSTVFFIMPSGRDWNIVLHYKCSQEDPLDAELQGVMRQAEFYHLYAGAFRLLKRPIDFPHSFAMAVKGFLDGGKESVQELRSHDGPGWRLRDLAPEELFSAEE